MAVVNLIVSACVLRATTKKVVNFFGEEKCTLRENPGYSYDRFVFLRISKYRLHGVIQSQQICQRLNTNSPADVCGFASLK